MNDATVIRDIAPYDPLADARDRWPGWTIAPADLRGVMPELMCAPKRIMLLDQAYYQKDPIRAEACAVAHLDLGHHERLDRLTVHDARRAQWLGDLRLDRVGVR